MNTKSYCQTIGYYKEDVMRLNKNLYFQQDGASCHTAKKSIAEINITFRNKLDFWPANSPDLSPIENIWSILKEKLHERKHQTLDDLKNHLIFLWNRIPVGLCRKLIMQFNKKINLIKKTGERINRIPKNKKKIIRLKQK